MKKITTEMTGKDEFCEWLKAVAEEGCGVWALCNGGGLSFIRPDDIGGLIANLYDDFSDDIERIEKGDEYEDFKDCMPADEYEGTECFFCFSYIGYDQANHDYQIQYWTL